MIDRICEICGKKFKIYPSKLKYGTGQYCSTDCFIEARKQGLIKMKKPKKGKILKCPVCNKEFYAQPNKVRRGRSYCSRICLGQANGNRLRGSRAPHAGKAPEIRKCRICGKKFNFYASQRNYGLCCSRNCANKWHSLKMKGANNPNWRDGISNYPYDQYFDRRKEQIRARDNWKCQLCGAPQEEFQRALPVHHIDYDKKNSSPDNLITLCPYCHTKTNYKRDYWKQYFQNKSNKRGEVVCL